ncbi:MAG: glycosyltransferase family 4 protein [Fibrobacterota bacterium]|nr:glycosyltransferase family 4 protein [Fibrobacterota bacterium]QQS03807.1 MAG: glycosyltransferase family 4 protein [Fibrobacterota bacterium]
MKDRYLLIQNAQVYRHQGKLYLDHLWKRDLERHLHYLSKVYLGSPIFDAAPPSDKYLPVDPEIQSRIIPIAIPKRWKPTNGRLAGIPIKISADIGILRHALKADLLHVSINEHPFFYGFLMPFLKWFTNTRTLIVIEATSHWRRLNPTGLKKWDMKIHEFTAKMAIKYATAAAFTSQEYRDTLAPTEGLYRVIPATWMDEESIISDEDFKVQLAEKITRLTDGFRIGFFARLIVDKGADLLLNAAKLVKESGVNVSVDIWGEGEELDNLKLLARELNVDANFPGMLRYGPDFFKALRQYHLVAVPNRLDEQPRIIFDTFSQGVPVVVSNTPGNLFCVREGENAMVFPKNDAAGLAKQIQAICQGEIDYALLSASARQTAGSRTHKAMHQARAKLLLEIEPKVKALI